MKPGAFVGVLRENYKVISLTKNHESLNNRPSHDYIFAIQTVSACPF